MNSTTIYIRCCIASNPYVVPNPINIQAVTADEHATKVHCKQID
jgi:hypothetical protein